MSPDDPRHGSHAGYRAHERAGEKPCAACLRAKVAYNERLRLDHMHGIRRQVDATGTRRRIHALVAIGWPFRSIAKHAGIDYTTVQRLASHQRYVWLDTADRLEDTFAAMCMTPAPASRNATYARRLAERRGWAPPLAWDDIDNDAAPAPMGSNRKNWPADELAAEARHLLSLGESIEQAARQLGVTPNAIEQARTRAA